jgi:hypothetical protein
LLPPPPPPPCQLLFPPLPPPRLLLYAIAATQAPLPALARRCSLLCVLLPQELLLFQSLHAGSALQTLLKSRVDRGTRVLFRVYAFVACVSEQTQCAQGVRVVVCACVCVTVSRGAACFLLRSYFTTLMLFQTASG